MNHPQSQTALEVVAAITAALAVVLDQPVGSFVVTSIRPEGLAPVPVPSAWGKAGVLEAQFARRQFGLRTR